MGGYNCVTAWLLGKHVRKVGCLVCLLLLLKVRNGIFPLPRRPESNPVLRGKNLVRQHLLRRFRALA